MNFIAILNSESGTLKSLDMHEVVQVLDRAFSQQGHCIEVKDVKGEGLAAYLEHATSNPQVDGIVAAGGDGTLSLAANYAWRNNKILAPLPAGTMNLFAHSLQLPANLFDAIETVAQGRVRAIDIATANGIPFIHQFSLGLHPSTIKKRDLYSYNSRISKMFAGVRAFFDTITHIPLHDVTYSVDGVEVRRKVSTFSVSNNVLADTMPPHATELDGGVLGLYAAGPLNTPKAIKLAVDLLTGRVSENQEIAVHEAKTIDLHINKITRYLYFAVDGELHDPVSEVRLRLHPKGLNVLTNAQIQPSCL